MSPKVSTKIVRKLTEHMSVATVDGSASLVLSYILSSFLPPLFPLPSVAHRRTMVCIVEEYVAAGGLSDAAGRSVTISVRIRANIMGRRLEGA